MLEKRRVPLRLQRPPPKRDGRLQRRRDSLPSKNAVLQAETAGRHVRVRAAEMRCEVASYRGTREHCGIRAGIAGAPEGGRSTMGIASTKASRVWVSLSLVGVLSLLPGCPGGPAAPCTPGEQQACACPGTDVTGAQVCASDGSGFGPCDGCPTPGTKQDSGTSCTPGQQISCACPGSEASGVQVCASDGATYGACRNCPVPAPDQDAAPTDAQAGPPEGGASD